MTENVKGKKKTLGVTSQLNRYAKKGPCFHFSSTASIFFLIFLFVQLPSLVVLFFCAKAICSPYQFLIGITYR